MRNSAWLRCFRRSSAPGRRLPNRGSIYRALVEELESRLAPANFAVDAHLRICDLDSSARSNGASRGVVFFESAVTDYQVLQRGLPGGVDGVVLDSAGDGL